MQMQIGWKGTIKDILFDETTGKFRYLLVDLGFWILARKSYYQLFFRININDERVYAKGSTKEQAKICLEFNDDSDWLWLWRSGKRYLLHLAIDTWWTQ